MGELLRDFAGLQRLPKGVHWCMEEQPPGRCTSLLRAMACFLLPRGGGVGTLEGMPVGWGVGTTM